MMGDIRRITDLERELQAKVDALTAERDELEASSRIRGDELARLRSPVPATHVCPAGCGCLWRDNKDGSMSLANGQQKSCATCEFLPLSALKPLDAAQPAQRLSDADIDTMVKQFPVEGYGLLCELPATQTGGQFKATLRAWVRVIEAAIVPPGYVVLEAESVREIIADVEQHIGQGKDSEQRLAADNPGYGTGTYTHLWRKMQKLRAMIESAPKA